jgi:hypothetical protein
MLKRNNNNNIGKCGIIGRCIISDEIWITFSLTIRFFINSLQLINNLISLK